MSAGWKKCNDAFWLKFVPCSIIIIIIIITTHVLMVLPWLPG
jgi:hypothetical protein